MKVFGNVSDGIGVNLSCSDEISNNSLIECKNV